MNSEELKVILENHKKWINSEGGARANLREANWEDVLDDFLPKLTALINEVPFLYKSIIDGKVNGSTYTGECACFIGTMANARKCEYTELESVVAIDSSSPTEKFFLGIKKGDTPENNPLSLLAKGWVEQFMNDNSVKIPTRTITWSV